jgi:hypothetical protein
MKKNLLQIATALLAGAIIFAPYPVFASSGAFVNMFSMNTQVASTVPANGDINPYGVVVVPRSSGALVKGNILVSNFNNANNLQGTGTTIVQVAPNGSVKLFAQIDPMTLPGSCPGGVGLTTALAVLREGWVIVGSLPTADGSSATTNVGCLIVLNRWGHVAETISGSMVKGPWDMTSFERDDKAFLFFSDVMNAPLMDTAVANGTIVRLVLNVDDDKMPRVLSRTEIGSGFDVRGDPNALVIGPTGVGLGKNGTLYVADTLGNRIAAIPNALNRKTSAGMGKTVLSGMALNGPLGLTVAPNGDILATNAGDGNLVEVTPGGSQVAVQNIDSTNTGAGTLFGLAIAPSGKGVYYVNDGNNTLNLLH